MVLRRGTVVADDIDPKTTSIEEVELIITGIDPRTLAGTDPARLFVRRARPPP